MYDIVIKYYFVIQNNILCVIGYEILMEFIPPSAVFNTAEGDPFEILKTIGARRFYPYVFYKMYFFNHIYILF